LFLQVWQTAPSTAAAVTAGGTEAQHPELDNILEPDFQEVDAVGLQSRGRMAYQVVSPKTPEQKFSTCFELLA
jgi:hypothetical protein